MSDLRHPLTQDWYNNPLREFEHAQLIVRTYMKTSPPNIRDSDDVFTTEWIDGLRKALYDFAPTVQYNAPNIVAGSRIGGTFIDHDPEWLAYPWSPPYLATWREYATGHSIHLVSLSQLYTNGTNNGTVL